MAVTDSSREACFKGSFVSRALKPVCSFKWPHSHVWREIKQMCGIGGIVRMLIPRSHLISSCLHCIHPYFIHCVYPVPFLTSFTQVYSTPLSHLIYSCLLYFFSTPSTCVYSVSSSKASGCWQGWSPRSCQRGLHFNRVLPLLLPMLIKSQNQAR